MSPIHPGKFRSCRRRLIAAPVSTTIDAVMATSTGSSHTIEGKAAPGRVASTQRKPSMKQPVHTAQPTPTTSPQYGQNIRRRSRPEKVRRLPRQ